MSAIRTLSLAGLSPDTAAQIQGILQAAGPQLRHRWRPTRDESADLMLIEPDQVSAGLALLIRCQTDGIAFVLIGDRRLNATPGSNVLHRPLNPAQVVALLNQIGAQRDDTAFIPETTPNFYDAHLDARSGPPPVAPFAAAAPTSQPHPRIDPLDLVLYGDPLKESELEALHLDESISLSDAKGSGGARSLLRDAAALENAGQIGPKTKIAGPLDPPEQGPEPGTLAALLQEGAIFSPVRLDPPGLPELILDPKPKRYYSPAPLQELSGYAHAHSLCARPIVGAALQQTRASQIARPYDELHWLLALYASDGHLSESLDPGGHFSLRRPLAAAAELRSHARITAVMTQPLPLHAIAHASGASMREVFDIVNAYAAIGRLDCILRPRLRSG